MSLPYKLTQIHNTRASKVSQLECENQELREYIQRLEHPGTSSHPGFFQPGTNDVRGAETASIAIRHSTAFGQEFGHLVRNCRSFQSRRWRRANAPRARTHDPYAPSPGTGWLWVPGRWARGARACAPEHHRSHHGRSAHRE